MMVLSRALLLCAALFLAGCEALPSDTQAPDVDYLETYDRALALYGDGDFAAAEPLFQSLTQNVPREADPWFRLGNIYARTQRPDLAIASYREAVLRKPDLHKAWHNMGVVQLQQAAKSFIELQQRIEESDPLHSRNRRFAEGVLDLLGEDPARKSQ